MTWQLLSELETAEEPYSRLTWEITPHSELAGATLVTLVHDEFDRSPHTARMLDNGLPIVLSGMKTLLETGAPM